MEGCRKNLLGFLRVLRNIAELEDENPGQCETQLGAYRLNWIISMIKLNFAVSFHSKPTVIEMIKSGSVEDQESFRTVLEEIANWGPSSVICDSTRSHALNVLSSM